MKNNSMEAVRLPFEVYENLHNLEEFMYMHALTFQEFLIALRMENLAEFISDFQLSDIIPPIIHKQLLELLRNYYFIGGMPEALKEYAENKDLLNVQRIQTELSTAKCRSNSYSASIHIVFHILFRGRKK